MSDPSIEAKFKILVSCLYSQLVENWSEDFCRDEKSNCVRKTHPDIHYAKALLELKIDRLDWYLPLTVEFSRSAENSYSGKRSTHHG